jgi:hypothetical protein
MKAIHPVKLLLWSFLVWLVFYIQLPVKYLYNGSIWFPLLTLILFISAFIFGIVSLKTASIKTLKTTSNKKLKQIAYLFFFIGLLGILLKIYIGFFKSGIYTSNDIFEQRIENMGKELSGGAIGAIASMLYPFSFLALLIGIYNYRVFNKVYLFIIIVFGLYPIIETFFMGGRTIIALLGATIIFVSYASFFKNTTFTILKFKVLNTTLASLPKFIFKKKVIIPLTIVSLLFVSYSIKVLDTRLTRFNYGDRVFKVWEQKDYQWVKIDKDFKQDFYRATSEEKSRMLGLFSLKHYFVHGVFEYVRLINDLEKTTGYYYGQYEFNVFFKFFKMLGVPLKSFGELSVVLKRQAVYQTFWGPFYIDFGLFGLIIMFFWGRFTKRIYTYAKQGSTPHLIFYGYFSTIIITSFFINFMLGSSSYFLFAFLISLLVFKYWSNNLNFVTKKKL